MSLFISLTAVLLTLTLSGAQTPGDPDPQSQCIGMPRCRSPSRIPEGQPQTWVSNIRVSSNNINPPNSPINSGRVKWNIDSRRQRVPMEEPYDIVYREMPSPGSRSNAGGMERPRYILKQQRSMSPDDMFLLKDLDPGTMYEVMVCRPGFNISSIRLDGNTSFISECGYCRTCYTTEAAFYDFDMTTVTRINETHVRIVCDVVSNIPQFFINWSISDPVDANQRMVLGDVIDEEPVSVVNERQGSNSYMSTLVAPEIILERDIQCIADSDYKTQSSESGAFELIEQDMAPQPDDFPMWAIILVAVVCLLTLICLIVAAALVVGLVFSCSRTRRRKFEPTEIQRKISESNEYLDAKLGLQKKMPLEEMSYKGKGKEIDLEKNVFSETALRRILTNDTTIIDSSLLQVTTIIGQGEYGVVYKGVLRKETNEIVAVKSLKGIFATESDVQLALQEIIKMKEFNHPNVMSLIGVSTGTSLSGGNPLIIMPYMARGSLLSYLRKERGQLILGANTDLTQVGAVQKLLMQICLQISKGMTYLASLRFVHRDLAARNCMIDEKGVIKVSDFGLAEDIYMRNYFRQSSQDMAVKLPLKWMAPESIKLGIFSEKSDVWSYGVTCWEVFTAGEIPYQGVHAREVIQLLEDGKHLTRPKNQACSDIMFAVMRSCWAYSTKDRPDFAHLASQIDTELTALAEYVDLSMFGGEGTDTQE